MSEFDGGYLSDVQTQFSNGSEISHDLLQSTKVLEGHFKSRYRVLKSAYEARIKQLSEIFSETCEALLKDEVLAEMKGDRTSSAFMPAHVTEFIQKHLESERESYVHQLVRKLSTLEVEIETKQRIIVDAQSKQSRTENELSKLRRNQIAVDPLKEKMELLEKEFDSLAQQSEEEVDDLKQKLAHTEMALQQSQQQYTALQSMHSEKLQECEWLANKAEDQSRELDTLQQSFEQSTRDIALIEGIEEQNKTTKQELKEQLKRTLDQRNSLSEEVVELRTKFQRSTEECQRWQSECAAKSAEEESNKQRVLALMSQVETMIAQEATESNAAIVSVHDKMRQLRHKMTLDIQREQRVGAALQEELATIRTVRDDQARDVKRYSEEAAGLRDNLNKEVERNSAMQRELADCQAKTLEYKLTIRDLQSSLQQSQEKLMEAKSWKSDELHLLEEKMRLKAAQEISDERSHIDTRTSAYRLHYENELGKVKNDLRHSYSFGSSIPAFTELTAELEMKGVVDKWRNSSTVMQANHEAELSKLHGILDSQYQVIDVLQNRLQTADKNIDHLRKMVQSSSNHEVTGDDASFRSRRDQNNSDLAAKTGDFSESRLSSSFRRPISVASINATPQRQATPPPVKPALLETSKSNQSNQTIQTSPYWRGDKCSDRERDALILNSSGKLPRLQAEYDKLMREYNALRQEHAKMKSIVIEGQDQESFYQQTIADMQDKIETVVQKYQHSMSHSTDTSPYEYLLEDTKNQLAQQSTLCASLSSQLEIERIRGAKGTRLEVQLQKNFSEMESKLSTEVRALKQALKAILRSVQDQAAAVESELVSFSVNYKRKARSVLESAANLNTRKFESLRRQLSNAHSLELGLLEESFQRQVEEHAQAHQLEMKETHGVAMARADSIISLASHGHVVTGRPSDAAASSSTSIQALNRAVTAHESVLEGVLDALVETGVIDNDIADELLQVALKHCQPSITAVSIAKSTISKHAKTFLRQSHNNESSHSVMFSPASAGHGVNTSSSFGAQHMTRDVLASSDLEQSRQEAAVLVELAKMEANCEIQTLHRKLEDQTRQHANDMSRAKADWLDLETGLRMTMEEELASSRSHEHSKLAAVEAQYHDEHKLCLRLQAKLKELASSSQQTIEDLENRNHVLTRRAEEAEMAKIKCELQLHRDTPNASNII